MDKYHYEEGLSSMGPDSDGTVATPLDVNSSYHIMRRSPMTPLFHPYYIEYGRDKIEFFEKLKYSHRIE